MAPGILEVRMGRPAGFNFLPGQFIRVIMDDYQRDYTIVSPPDADTIAFCIALVEAGRFSNIIANARAGDRFQLSGPHGHFIFQGATHPPVFVATGTGVAPFVAFCCSGVKDALLLHGVATPDQLIYRYLLEPCLRAYVPCISGSFDAKGCLKGAFTGRVTAYLEKLLAPDAYDFYLCGQRAMIKAVTALIDDRFDGSRVFIENFD
jgi:ferredoxin-NADP reductase